VRWSVWWFVWLSYGDRYLDGLQEPSSGPVRLHSANRINTHQREREREREREYVVGQHGTCLQRMIGSATAHSVHGKSYIGRQRGRRLTTVPVLCCSQTASCLAYHSLHCASHTSTAKSPAARRPVVGSVPLVGKARGRIIE
jgi:hypothetical protein